MAQMATGSRSAAGDVAKIATGLRAIRLADV
jgi:hypothetical protein